MVVFQTPAGDILDKTRRGKKVITTFAILVAAVTTVMIVWTSNFWIVLMEHLVNLLQNFEPEDLVLVAAIKARLLVLAPLA